MVTDDVKKLLDKIKKKKKKRKRLFIWDLMVKKKYLCKRPVWAWTLTWPKHMWSKLGFLQFISTRLRLGYDNV